jgi:nucleoside-diphosphate-sugar epimerase
MGQAVKILLYGATGAAGGAVVRACLNAPMVREVRAISRRPLALAHEKLRAFVHKDFLDYSAIPEAFTGIDACLFCLGVSATQVTEEEYRRITHDFTLAAAHAVKEHSPSSAFHYISGSGTNEGGRMMWQKVKGGTERELIELVGAVCWRTAAIGGVAAEHSPWFYKIVRPMLGVLKPFRGLYIGGEALGRAMLQATIEKMRGRILENADIRDVAERATW